MKVLIYDPHQDVPRTVSKILTAQGHDIQTITHIDEIQTLSDKEISAIFIPKLPEKHAQSFYTVIKQEISNFVYMIEYGKAQLNSGPIRANAYLKLPAKEDILDTAMENALRLLNFSKRMSDLSSDYPNAGGVISKSAFNQIFLSGLNRGGRYDEEAYILHIGVVSEAALCGEYTAEECHYMGAEMANFLGKIRRQSDIIGQIGKVEFALFLQRPRRKDEPLNAAKRFARFLEDSDILKSNLKYSVELMTLPSGQVLYEHHIS